MHINSKHLPADERRAVIVAAVLDLAAEQNPSEITTAAIAKRMNLTQGALFRHFPSKDAIWQAVMEWVADQLLTRVEEAARDAATPLAGLEAMFLAHTAFVVAHPGVPRMMFGELQRAEDTAAKAMARTLIGRYGERLVSLIDRGKMQGELAAEIDSAAAAALFIGMIQGLVMQSLLAGEPNRMHDEAPRVFAIYLRGVGRVK
ncbi:MAG: TetR/AcrR family transcriptional regulator [Smithellaceae bacterium]|nr:TetR/AcrR family transcriptional regulator [Smithellaceae bacterium]